MNHEYSMMRTMICIMAIFGLLFLPAFSTTAKASQNECFLGNVQKKDSEYNKIMDKKKDDIHYGWELGHFHISGYSQKMMEDGKNVFLRDKGDEICLSFHLDQDIESLNKNNNLIIADDNDGYDKYFDSKNKTKSFKKGALFVKVTDSQNNTNDYPYYDYLTGKKRGADTNIKILEEGDYEVALDYEIEVRTTDSAETRHNYQIYAQFSVRNGGCNVFPIELVTNKELSDGSFTDKGFKVDLAGAKYLNMTVSHFEYSDKGNRYVKEMKYNKTKTEKDGFTKKGSYEITVSNTITKRSEKKTIYVKMDPVFKAYVYSGKSPDEIKQLLKEGMEIKDDGRIESSSSSDESEESIIQTGKTDDNSDQNNDESKKKNIMQTFISGVKERTTGFFSKNE